MHARAPTRRRVGPTTALTHEARPHTALRGTKKRVVSPGRTRTAHAIGSVAHQNCGPARRRRHAACPPSVAQRKPTIDVLTPRGRIVNVATLFANGDPNPHNLNGPLGSLVVGPDGTVWFTDRLGNSIDRTGGEPHRADRALRLHLKRRGPDARQRPLRHRRGGRWIDLVHGGASRQDRPLATAIYAAPNQYKSSILNGTRGGARL